MAWPWIIVAPCSVILIPHVNQEQLDTVFPTMLVTLLPIGMRGLPSLPWWLLLAQRSARFLTGQVATWLSICIKDT